jgi:DNA-binding MarR family transcriptional regulator
VLDRFFPDRHPSLTEAAGRYGSSRQNVKQIALQLEEAGFLRLAPDPVDRRATRLVRTDRVAVFAEPTEAARGRALLDEIYAGLSPADVRRLRDLIRRWVRLLEAGGRRSITTPNREAS